MAGFLGRALLATAAAVALIPAAQAAAAPHVIVWSGGLVPGATAQGVEVRADGTARRLTSAGSAVRDAGALKMSGKELAAVRRAANKLLSSGPAVTASGVVDGGYVSALLEDGAKRRAVVDTGAGSPQLDALLKALDDALP